MNFVEELMAKLAKGPVLVRDRGPERKKRAKKVKPVRAKSDEGAEPPEQPEKRSKAIKAPKSYPTTNRTRKNALNAIYDASIKGMWYHFHRACRAKQKLYEKKGKPESVAKWEFTIPLDVWVLTWVSIPDIMVIEGEGIAAEAVMRPAWKLRGKSHKTDVHLARLDQSLPWTCDNTIVKYRGAILARFNNP